MSIRKKYALWTLGILFLIFLVIHTHLRFHLPAAAWGVGVLSGVLGGGISRLLAIYLSRRFGWHTLTGWGFASLILLLLMSGHVGLLYSLAGNTSFDPPWIVQLMIINMMNVLLLPMIMSANVLFIKRTSMLMDVLLRLGFYPLLCVVWGLTISPSTFMRWRPGIWLGFVVAMVGTSYLIDVFARGTEIAGLQEMRTVRNPRRNNRLEIRMYPLKAELVKEFIAHLETAYDARVERTGGEPDAMVAWQIFVRGSHLFLVVYSKHPDEVVAYAEEPDAEDLLQMIAESFLSELADSQPRRG